MTRAMTRAINHLSAVMQRSACGSYPKRLVGVDVDDVVMVVTVFALLLVMPTVMRELKHAIRTPRDRRWARRVWPGPFYWRI